MNKTYVLNNSLDETLFLKDSVHDTRNVNESKKFPTRKLAEKYIGKRQLSEKYSVKLVSHRLTNINESIEDNKYICDEISSAIDDTKDMIDTTLEFIELYYKSDDKSLSEEIFDGSNIEDVLDRLRKLKKGVSGICFRSSFYDSDGSGMVSDVIPSDNPDSSNGGDNIE